MCEGSEHALERPEHAGGAPPVYEEFEPVRLAQHAGRQALPPFPTFDAALDEFFGKVRLTQ